MGPNEKLLTIEDLCAERERLRESGRTLAQCHGCFDLIHPGHIRHLKQAAKEADVLLVSLTADPQVGKGDGRPLFSESLRAENLAALGIVDLVVVSREPTAESLLERVRPDVYIKGREYESNEDPRFAAERRTVERHGGRVVFTSGDLVFSSTALIGAMTSGAGEGVEADPRYQALRRLRSLHDLSLETLAAHVDRMAGRRALVVGETIIDTYIACDRPEVASEGACLSLRPLERLSFDGGAAVVALHAAALGARPTLVTALPKGDQAESFRARMAAAGVTVRSVVSDAPMLEKQRFLVGDTKVMKLDLVAPVTLDASRRSQLHAMCHEVASEGTDASILVDFGHGMLTRRSIEALTALLRPLSGVLSGDVSGKRTALSAMRGADLLTPTEAELRDAVGDYDSSLSVVVWELMEASGARTIATTMGEDGLIVFRRTREARAEGWHSRVSGEHIPGLESFAVDTLGCGDALLATASLALAAGAGEIEACYLGAVAAALESRLPGNEPIGAAALVERLRWIDEGRLAVRTRSVRPASFAGAAF